MWLSSNNFATTFAFSLSINSCKPTLLHMCYNKCSVYFKAKKSKQANFFTWHSQWTPVNSSSHSWQYLSDGFCCIHNLCPLNSATGNCSTKINTYIYISISGMYFYCLTLLPFSKIQKYIFLRHNLSNLSSN